MWNVKWKVVNKKLFPYYTFSGDNKIMEAHNVVLSASSIFFPKLLKQIKSHPLTYLKGIENSFLE